MWCVVGIEMVVLQSKTTYIWLHQLIRVHFPVARFANILRAKVGCGQHDRSRTTFAKIFLLRPWLIRVHTIICMSGLERRTRMKDYREGPWRWWSAIYSARARWRLKPIRGHLQCWARLNPLEFWVKSTRIIVGRDLRGFEHTKRRLRPRRWRPERSSRRKSLSVSFKVAFGIRTNGKSLATAL